MEGLVSVVLPTYNREKTLMRSISSVLNQTYSNLELIIVDDGSKDNTRQLISSIEDNRVCYIWQENQGACVARNRGVAETKGELIAFQDSDDEWYPEKIERQIQYMRETNADVVFCAFCRKGLEEYEEHIPDYRIPSKQVYFDDIVPVNMMGTITILGKRNCFINEPFNGDYKRFQDWELCMRLVRKYKVFYDNSVLANAFVSEDNISKKPELALHSIFGILHNTVGGYREILLEQEQAKKEVINQLYQKECAIEQYKKEIAEYKREIDEYKREIDEYKREIDEYRFSTSWKTTAPFRAFLQRFRKIGS